MDQQPLGSLFVPISRRARAVVTGVVTVTAGAGAYLCGEAAPALHKSKHAWDVAGAVVLTALTGAAPSLEQYRQTRERRAAENLAKAAREDLRVTLTDTLEPLTKILGEVRNATSGPVKEQLRGEGIHSVVYAAAQLIGTDRARACFYKIQVTPGLARRVVPQVHAGRSGRPSHIFTVGTPAGDAVFKMIDNGERRYCPDVSTHPPPGWQGTQSGYKTFVSVSVRAVTRPWGMLTLDALEPGDLRLEEEAGLMDVLANLLGAILSA